MNSRRLTRSPRSRAVMRPTRGPVGYYRRKAETSEEVAGELVIARGDPTKILQPTEHALNRIALPICRFIERESFFAGAPARDDCLGIPGLQHQPETVGIIALVADQ